jgi:dihydropyrimidinase
MTRTLIRNGLVITAADELAADVLVDGEQVVALAASGSEVAEGWTADTVLDATGKYVVPGGVDAHTHMEMPFGGTRSADTFETGTRAAAWGGTTTIVDFAIQSMGGSLREGLDTWHAKAAGNCAIDYSFHMIVADVNDSSLKEMEALVGEGVTSFKLFMAYPGVFYSDDGKILRALQKGAETGGLTMMHAENGIAIDVLIEQALAKGQTDPRYHGEVRHALLEAEATHRAIKLAQVAGAPVYIVHLSAAQALAQVAQARDEGFNAFAETCPQYLFLSTDDLARPGFEGAKYVCSTPLRPVEPPGRAVEGACGTDDLSVVSTDHCPFCFTGRRTWASATSRRSPTACPAWRPGWTCSTRPSSRAHLRAALDRARLRHPGADVRALPAQGHDRAGLGRRRGRLRPGAPPGAQRRDAPHERRLLLLRGPDRDRPGRDRALPRPGGRGRGRVPRREGPRPVPAPRHVRVPAMSHATMDVGLVLQTDPPGPHRRRPAGAGGGAGVQPRWTFDSHVLWQEPYVLYPQVLERTSRLVVGPMVTNPATRDWTVVASMHATLNEQFGNRTICGIGRGDSAVRVQGPASDPRWPGSRRPSASSATWRRPGGGPRRDGGSGSRGWSRAACSRCGWPGTGPGRWTWSGGSPTGSSCSWPTRTWWSGRSSRCARRPRPPAATRRRSPCAWPPPPTSVTTSPTPATSAAGSAGWSATTWPTW